MRRHPKAGFAAFALILLGVLAIARGQSYFRVDSAPTGLDAADALLSLTLWGWVWIAGGVLAIVAVRCPRVLVAASAVMIAVNVVWIASFLIAWAGGDNDRGYVSAISYGHGLLSWLVVPWMVNHVRAYEEARCSETDG